MPDPNPSERLACAECGMPIASWTEFHPIEACLEFKRTGDARRVYVLLREQAEERANRQRLRHELAKAIGAEQSVLGEAASDD